MNGELPHRPPVWLQDTDANDRGETVPFGRGSQTLSSSSTESLLDITSISGNGGFVKQIFCFLLLLSAAGKAGVHCSSGIRVAGERCRRGKWKRGEAPRTPPGRPTGLADSPASTSQ